MRVKLLFSESLRSLGANLSTTIAATMTVLIGMFLLGLFIALGSWVVSWSDHVKRELLVKVFYEQDASAGADQRRPRRLDSTPIRASKSITFVSADKALERMQKKFPELTENLPSNPLPPSHEIVPVHAEDVDAIAGEPRAALPAGVDKVKYGKETADRILRVARVIEIVFLAAVIVLLDRLDAPDREHDPPLDLLAPP